MAEIIEKTDERIEPCNVTSKEDYLIYLRHLFAYEASKERISENSLVLDVGCGEGYGTRLLSENVMRIIGLDIDAPTIKNAFRKYGSDKCLFVAYDGVSIPHKDDTFDSVVSFQVIEHIRDVEKYVSEIYRVLGKNGSFILTTPNRIHRLKPGQKPWNKFHIKEFYPYEIEDLLRTKFKNVEILGIRGNEEVQQIEMKRVKPTEESSNTRSMIELFDPFRIRKLIPGSLKAWIIKGLRGKGFEKKRLNENDRDFAGRYNLGVYSIIERNVEEGLDILGICKK